jgi:hypothetical protein
MAADSAHRFLNAKGEVEIVADTQVGFGPIVASEIEPPNILANLV